jgi:hypothetical protein
MKNAFGLILVLFLFGCNQGPHQITIKRSTPEELCETVFETLKYNDSKTFVALFYDQKDVENGIEARWKDNQKAYRKQALTKMSKDIKKGRFDWSSTRNEIKKRGINWEDFELKKSTFDMDKIPNVSIEYADLYLFFDHNSVEYKIRLGNCFNTGNGWKISEAPLFMGKSGK